MISRQRLLRLIALLGTLALAAETRSAAQSAPEPTPAEAEPKPTTLVERVTVTATRNPRQLKDTPGAVSVVEAQDIEDQGMADTRDLLRYEPGVYVDGDPTRLGPSGFNIRGIGGNRVMTRIDGIQTAEQFEFGPLSVPQYALDLDAVESVEIVRSAGSALYGSDALGGMVSFRTKGPSDYLSRTSRDVYAGLRGGYDGRDGQTSWLGSVAFQGGPRWQASVQLTRRDGHERDNQGGLATSDASRTRPNPQDLGTTGALAKWVFKATERNALELAVERFDASADTEVLSARGPSTPGLAVDDFDARDTHDRWRVSATHTLRRTGAWYDELVWRAYVQRSATEERTFEKLTRTQGATTRVGLLEFSQDTLGLDLQVTKHLAGAHDVTYGASLSRDTFDQLRDRNETLVSDGSAVPSALVFPTKYFPKSNVTESALYVQDEIRLIQGRIRLVPGLRLDRYAMDARQADQTYLDGNPGTDPPVDVTDTALSPRFGIVGQVTSQASVFGQYARGFRAPPYSSINGGFTNPTFMYRTLPNSDLRPETSDSVEVGLRAGLEHGSASLVVFENRYDDFIDTVATTADDGFTEFQPQNVDRVTISGIELAGDARLGRSFGLRCATAYVQGTNDVDDQPLESVAPPKVVVGLAYRSVGRPWGAELTTTFVAGKAQRDLPDGSTQFRPPSQQVVDLTGSWSPIARLKLNLGLSNLTDEKYWSWADVRGQSQSSPTIDRYSSPGRSAWMHVRYEF